MDTEKLGAAETVLQSVMTYADHMFHNRPGLVVPDPKSRVGVRWDYATYREKCPAHPDATVRPERLEKRPTGRLLCAECQADVRESGLFILYRKTRVGKKDVETRVGVMNEATGVVTEHGQVVGQYRRAGIFPEVAKWMYESVVNVWSVDNEFAARWASYAFGEDHKDRAVVMAAFMLVQSRKGDPVSDGGKVLFYDEDFRDVGEAMVLHTKGKKDKREGGEISPRMLLKIHELLTTPEIADINRKLGFGVSARKPCLGRWPKVVEKWLRFREENPRMLEGLVKSGQKGTVVDLIQRVGYKPASPKFFEILGVRQKQAKDGRRTVAIGQEIAAATSWEGLTEEQVCEAVMAERVSYKRAVGLVPKAVGMTRAIMVACIEAGGVSDKEMIILMPTLEDLGLLEVQTVKERIDRAVAAASDQRASNVAARMRSQGAKDQLTEASDNAAKAAVAEVMKDMRVYVVVDISASQDGAIEKAKAQLPKFLVAFPADRVHVSHFNTVGRELRIPHPSTAGVTAAFAGIKANGGTDYGQGVLALLHTPPSEAEDSLMIFIGDEFNKPPHDATFEAEVRGSGLRPMAFGLIVNLSPNTVGFPRGSSVRRTAAALGIPCFELDEATFSDVYAIPRAIRNLVASTPVSAARAASPAVRRKTLVETIMACPLLVKPSWAA
jgi:predicted nucleic acid-binding protein